MSHSAPPAIEELLAHADFAAALARQLLRDGDRAGDLTQQAWLRALERPPTPGPRLRAWLAGLLRNLARNDARAAVRRLRHEQLAARNEAQPAADELTGAIEAQRLVATALLRVEEPYRETLLRRWYRDEKPAAIARAMGAPVKTIDTRLARGLERLRAELTELKQGDRDGWRRELALLAAPTTGGSLTLAGPGAIAMSSSAKWVAALLVGATLIAGWRFGAPAEDDGARLAEGPRDPASAVVATADGPRAPSVSAPLAPAAERVASEIDAPPLDAAPSDAAAAAPATVRGRVVSSETGEPLSGVQVMLRPAAAIIASVAATTRSDAEGRFEVPRCALPARLLLHATGFDSHDQRFGRGEAALLDSGDLGVIELVPQHEATLLCTLRPAGGGPLPERLRSAGSVLIGPGAGVEPESMARFLDAAAPPSARSRALGLVAERAGERWRRERLPTGLPLHAYAYLGESVVGHVEVAPLASGEVREVTIEVTDSISITLRWIDAESGESLEVADAPALSWVAIAWRGEGGEPPLDERREPRKFAGEVALPGPGRLTVQHALRGFAPGSVETDVEAGSEVEIALTAWRAVKVDFATAEGEPYWDPPIEERVENATTRWTGGHPHESRRQLTLWAGPPGQSPPATFHHELDDANRATRTTTAAAGRFGIDGFQLHLPPEPRRLVLYADGEPIAQVVIDAAATQASLIAAIDPLPTGALRFRVVDRASGAPLPAYRVRLTRQVGPSRDHPAQQMGFEVDDPEQRGFLAERLQAGTYTLEIAGEVRDAAAKEGARRIVVEADREVDLGTIAIDPLDAADPMSRGGRTRR
ncbi:MAG: sigma-70 family RNA polymerase sigma factor [Planctomycetes bacterium]|nr:sigma-70 family RNA polymerase sigma factor [Planctomycetota bacterium]